MYVNSLKFFSHTHPIFQSFDCRSSQEIENQDIFLKLFSFPF
jgi:hypothetical protein